MKFDHLKPVTSSQIARVGYLPDQQALDIEFVSGGIYRYADVSAEQATALLEAESLGVHFRDHIRNGHATTKYNPHQQAFEAIQAKPASGKQIDMIRNQAKRAGYWDGRAGERITPMWRNALKAAGVELPVEPTLVEDMLAKLTSAQASAVIEFVKGA